ncbi:MAG: hypothetical protein JWR18_483 [Segetibacter sp.]|jgi:hypothetical protein|nr:hypothetical protein [Segetibacter sp.]
MKTLLILFLLTAFASCGGGTSESEAKSSDTTVVDSSFNKRVMVDSSTTNEMNADTTGMSNAR